MQAIPESPYGRLHPDVADCAVVTLPDGIRGELPAAAAVLRRGYVPTEELTRELQKREKRFYVAYAHTPHIHYPEVLPKTPSG